MIGIPFIARGFALLLILIGLSLACENTLISADVLRAESGANTLSSSAIAVACTGIEMAAASWVIRGGSFETMGKWLKHKPVSTLCRLFFGGLVLAVVYHFDILTTYLHPSFKTENAYFFSAVVFSFVFGPEICLVIGWWLWLKATEEETKMMAKTNSKVAENAFWHENRKRMVAHAIARARALADKAAVKRWGADE